MTQQTRQEVPGSDVGCVPRILEHRWSIETPGGSAAEREGGDVFEAQRHDEGVPPEGFHLVDLERQPEGERCELDDDADAGNSESSSPGCSPESLSVME